MLLRFATSPLTFVSIVADTLLHGSRLLASCEELLTSSYCYFGDVNLDQCDESLLASFKYRINLFRLVNW